MSKNKNKNYMPYPGTPNAGPNTGTNTSATETGNKANMGANMVTVAYNAPRGIVFTVGGSRRVHVNGNNLHLVGKEKGIISVGKYGYTRIDANDWDEIKKTYGSMAIFQNGLIFAESSKDRAEDRAEEQSETRHGLEPATPGEKVEEAVTPDAV